MLVVWVRRHRCFLAYCRCIALTISKPPAAKENRLIPQKLERDRFHDVATFYRVVILKRFGCRVAAEAFLSEPSFLEHLNSTCPSERMADPCS